MTNRQCYITNKNEHDMMMAIRLAQQGGRDMRPIDADDLKRYICETCEQHERCKDTENVCSVIADIDEQPRLDVEVVKHGRWIYGENEDGQDGIFCSECDHFVPWYYDYYDKTDDLINDNPRCPNCGARMDGG